MHLGLRLRKPLPRYWGSVSVESVKVMSFPMTILMSAFLDGGQVFNSEFGDDFNLNPGMSVRMANPPNVGFTFNVAYGQDGLLSTGGITLPI